jgi:replicative DNA helicase
LAIDYLQILPMSKDEAERVTSSKDRLDLHVSGLRQLGRDLNASVIAISSENRAGYTKKNLDVFKESGGIEYSADIAAVLSEDKKANSSGKNDYRLVDLNIVKNRNGETGVVRFKFYAKRAEFIETERSELTVDDQGG